MRYVLGFAISGTEKVLLIRKNRPQWQKGKLNGVGGKVEGQESDQEAMVREFWEETGVRTVKGQWIHFATMYGDGYECACFVTYSNRLVQMARSVTDEQLEVHAISTLFAGDVLPNVVYLVTLANDESLHFPIQLRYGNYDRAAVSAREIA